MSLWTPGGEHPVERDPTPEPESARAADGPGPAGPEGIDLESLSPEERAQVEEMAAQMQEAQERLASVPAADVLADYLMGIYQLAAIHLSSEPPKLAEARLAIDAMKLVVDGLRGRLGQAEATLEQATQQLQMAFVQRADEA